MILRYFLITSRVRLAVFADQTELSAILPIVKSCNVKPPVAENSSDWILPQIVLQCENNGWKSCSVNSALVNTHPEQQARAEGGALGAQAPAPFQNYPKVPVSDK